MLIKNNLLWDPLNKNLVLIDEVIENITKVTYKT